MWHYYYDQRVAYREPGAKNVLSVTLLVWVRALTSMKSRKSLTRSFAYFEASLQRCTSTSAAVQQVSSRLNFPELAVP